MPKDHPSRSSRASNLPPSMNDNIPSIIRHSSSSSDRSRSSPSPQRDTSANSLDISVPLCLGFFPRTLFSGFCFVLDSTIMVEDEILSLSARLEAAGATVFRMSAWECSSESPSSAAVTNSLPASLSNANYIRLCVRGKHDQKSVLDVTSLAVTTDWIEQCIHFGALIPWNRYVELNPDRRLPQEKEPDHRLVSREEDLENTTDGREEEGGELVHGRSALNLFLASAPYLLDKQTYIEFSKRFYEQHREIFPRLTEHTARHWFTKHRSQLVRRSREIFRECDNPFERRLRMKRRGE